MPNHYSQGPSTLYSSHIVYKMNFRYLLVTIITVLYVTSSFSVAEVTPKQEVSTDDRRVVQAAEFAVKELQSLSDSGVYKALSLRRILSATKQTGVYHDIITLKIELSSAHFDSGSSSETFDVIVLKSLEDGLWSFAINEFPRMKEHAIEEYWIEMVEKHRQLRESKFLELEEKGLLDEALKDMADAGKSSKSIDLNAERMKFKQMDTATLEKLEHSDDGPATAKIYNYQKYLVSKELDLRWKDTYRASQLKYDEEIKHLYGKKMLAHDEL